MNKSEFMYYLKPKFCNVLDFGGQAIVIAKKNEKLLWSYGEPVLSIKNREVFRQYDQIDCLSELHCMEFLKQEGVDFDALEGNTMAEKFQNFKKGEYYDD